MGTGEGLSRCQAYKRSGGVVGPAEVGPTPFSQPWAALPAQLGIQLQLQAAAQPSFCKCFPGSSSLQAEGKSPRVQADTRCVLCEGARCPGEGRRNARENFKPSLLAGWCYLLLQTQSCKKRKASPDKTGT